MILYGPPGTGKTTLARLMATNARAAFEEASAVNAGRQEVRDVLERAEHRRSTSSEPTIFFLDEIHRFNKAQQDTLLPAVEEGLVVLVGATTENPYFEVNNALLSRTQVYELRQLKPEQVWPCSSARWATSAGWAASARRPTTRWSSSPPARGGDARTALAALELACETVGDRPVSLRHAEDALQRRALRYDKEGDQHYDTISAWIKATRGSDPDASLLYLATMLEGGEDPRFIARRMVILASEDIGNADPRALEVAVAAAHAVEHVGLPECAHNLAQACVYLALAPKSNASYKALGAARAWVRENGVPDIPALPALGRLPRRREPGPRAGLRVPPRRGRRAHRAGAHAARGRGRALPRPLRARRGGGHARARRGAATAQERVLSLEALEDARSVQPYWAALPLADRARYLRRSAQVILDSLDPLAKLIAPEHRASPARRPCPPSCSPRSTRCTAPPATGPRCWPTAAWACPCSPGPSARPGLRAAGRDRACGRRTPSRGRCRCRRSALALMCGNGVVLDATLGERIRWVFERAGVPEGVVCCVEPGRWTAWT